jgi:hypothetical protein
VLTIRKVSQEQNKFKFLKHEYEIIVFICCIIVHHSGEIFFKKKKIKFFKKYFFFLKIIQQFTQADFMDDVKDVWKSSVKGIKNTFSVRFTFLMSQLITIKLINVNFTINKK